LNVIVFWPLLLLALLVSLRPAGDSAYVRLARTDRNPGFPSDLYLFPLATLGLSILVYLASYTQNWALPYVLIMFMLWILTLARLVIHILPNFSPAMENVPTYLRRRYRHPRLMYLLLLTIEAFALALIVPVVAFNAEPGVIAWEQHIGALQGFYRPDDWLQMLLDRGGSRERLVVNISGILFGVALLSYFLRSLAYANPFGWEDPFKLVDSDYVQIAESAARAGDFDKAEEALALLTENSAESYRVAAIINMGRRRAQSAADKIAERRKLLRKKHDDRAVFHELLHHLRLVNLDASAERAVFAWAEAAGVADEDIAHAVTGAAPGSPPAVWSRHVITLLGLPAEDPSNGLKALSKRLPLTAMCIMAGSPERDAKDFEALLQTHASHPSEASFLRRAMTVGAFTSNPQGAALKALITLMQEIADADCDDEDFAMVATYVENAGRKMQARLAEPEGKVDTAGLAEARSILASIARGIESRREPSADLIAVLGIVRSRLDKLVQRAALRDQELRGGKAPSDVDRP
jgi:hypothetical protein